MTDSTEVVQYTPEGTALTATDPTDFADMWADPEYVEELTAEEEKEGGDALSAEEKQIMADRHEPFTVTKIDPVKAGTFASFWPIHVTLQSGQERMMFLSDHEQRNGAILTIQHRINKTQRPVGNVMLKTSFVSQGNAFFVLRPWDGQVQTGLGAAKPVNRLNEDGSRQPAVGTPGPVQDSDFEPPGVGSVASPENV